MPNALHGHRWTLLPHFRGLFGAPEIPGSRRIRATFHDPLRGEIAITGRLAPEPTNGELLVVVHGLGGSTSSKYMSRAVAAALRAGIGCLRMNMRGADRSGDDVYHGGLGEDIGRLLASPELVDVKTIYLLGYSLGGHLVLCYAAGAMDERVAAVASVCAPLDFDAGATELDKPAGRFYREHCLEGLREVHAAAHRRMPTHVGIDRVKRVTRLREWDDVVVAPRYGFKSAEHYYSHVSVGPRLSAIEAPTLMIVTEHDPMVRLSTLVPHLTGTGTVDVIRSRFGGHVGFPPDIDLGIGPRGPLEDQLVRWLRDHGPASKQERT